MTSFTNRVHRAIDLAARTHAGQFRKDPDIQTPYVAHVFAVAYLLAEYDFPEHVVIAGLLHDVLEDRPLFMPEVETFGPLVVTLVRHVSETKTAADGEKLPWEQRKAAYIEHMRGAPGEAKSISCADKIHNMQSMLLAQARGADLWAQLSAPPQEQIARFEALLGALAEGWCHPLLDRYDKILHEVRALVEQA